MVLLKMYMAVEALVEVLTLLVSTALQVTVMLLSVILPELLWKKSPCALSCTVTKSISTSEFEKYMAERPG